MVADILYTTYTPSVYTPAGFISSSYFSFLQYRIYKWILSFLSIKNKIGWIKVEQRHGKKERERVREDYNHFEMDGWLA